MKVIKSIGIKLNTTIEQEKELKSLFEAFRLGINFSLKEIEKRYQLFLDRYIEIKRDIQSEGVCPSCNKQNRLSYYDSHTKMNICMSCAKRGYSEYTVRKEIYGVGDRVVVTDLKSIAEIPTKTHYSILFGQAYSIWNSYNSWRLKRLREQQILVEKLNELRNIMSESLQAAEDIEKYAEGLKRNNNNLTWKHAKAQATKRVYSEHIEKLHPEIIQLHDKLMELRRLSKPIHFPNLSECRTVMLSSNFVIWKNGELFLTLFHKKAHKIEYYGKKYLNTLLNNQKRSYIQLMEEDNNAYCNLTKKADAYYLMYPLSIEVKQPIDINECDTFVFMTSPTKTVVAKYDGNGTLVSVKWFNTGILSFAKRHFKEKRAEIAHRRFDTEKMRKIRRRRKKLKRMGTIEARTVSTFNHQLTRKIIDYVMEQSENPKILIWDIGNGITQNFGHKLNYLKNLWPAIQQQDYLKHKAMQMSIPVVEIKYNLHNDLICSLCGAKQINETEKNKKPMKVITQLIKGIKNFKCKQCGYEVNMLINQANNIVCV